MATHFQIRKILAPATFRSWVGLLTLLLLCLPTLLMAQNTGAGNASTLRTKEGTVEIQPAGSTTWAAMNVGQALRIGDRLRTGRQSRVTVQLSDLSVLRVSELTSFELQPPRKADGKPVIDIKAGAAYFFSRDKAQEIQLKTPVATGAVRGTEFNVTVAPDGRTELTLLNGEVELTNTEGSLVLKDGEQGVVVAGRAPVKTAVINAQIVVQWNLYYPAVLDPLELKLDPEAERDLQESLTAYRDGDLIKALNTYPVGRTATCGSG